MITQCGGLLAYTAFWLVVVVIAVVVLNHLDNRQGGEDMAEDGPLERLAKVAHDDPDPAKRGLTASALIDEHRARIEDLTEVRGAAIERLVQLGRSYKQIAHDVGISKGRVGQILSERRKRGDDNATDKC